MLFRNIGSLRAGHEEKVWRTHTLLHTRTQTDSHTARHHQTRNHHYATLKIQHNKVSLPVFFFFLEKKRTKERLLIKRPEQTGLILKKLCFSSFWLLLTMKKPPQLFLICSHIPLSTLKGTPHPPASIWSLSTP